MSYIQGEGRSQGRLFPVVLDDLIPSDHVCRVLDTFVSGLAMAELGRERRRQRRAVLATIRAIFSSCISMAISTSYAHHVGWKRSAAATWS
jgi:hypothetical protein